MAFVHIEGVDVYYETHGNGEDVLFLHHGFGSSKMWKKIYPGLVKEGYRVIMYDRRGYGLSERGVNFKEYYMSNNYRFNSVKEMAELTDRLGINKFHLIGQCEGGVVAVDFAKEYPEKVDKVVLSSTLCFSEKRMEDFNRLKFPRSFQELDQEVREKMIAWQGKEYAKPNYEMYSTYGGAYGKDFFDLREVLPMVRCPSLVIYPDRSSLFEVEQGVELYRHLQNGELAVLSKCGHNTYEHQPGAYVRLVLDFLERNGNQKLRDFKDIPGVF